MESKLRPELQQLVQKTILLKFTLPNTPEKINRSVHSTENDQCLTVSCSDDLAKVIYNSIIDYSLGEFELKQRAYQKSLAIAIQTRLKYNPLAKTEDKIKYGFLGEVVLYSVLTCVLNAKPAIARGYFYNPLENSETKGYDSYHLLESNGNVELWFGEVKFYIDGKAAINSVMTNLSKALSDNYLEQNILAISNQKQNANIAGSKIIDIIEAWEDCPEIRIIEEIKSRGLKFVYPIMILYQSSKPSYEGKISEIIDHIAVTHPTIAKSLSVNFEIFLILLPVDEVVKTKKKVIQWIESKEPLL